MQSFAPHTPLLQTNVQQSCGSVHELPAGLHSPMESMQVPLARSQLAVQQSAWLAQDEPTGLQAAASPVAPEAPAMPELPLAPPLPAVVPPAPPWPASAPKL